MDTFTLENQFTSGVYGKREVAIVRGRGAMVWDGDGRVYIDCAAGTAVANVGHCHPAVVDAITRQAQTLITCQEMFYNDERARFMSRLAAILPGDLNRVFLCNSGTEAVEAALKFARLSTGRAEVVAMMRGFHGRTFGALSATHKSDYREPFQPLVPGFSHVPFGNVARLDTAVSEQTAAVILEIVQGEGGVRLADPAFFQAARRLCDERGALLIVDEVQTGYGRIGTFFACEQVGITPDLICLGKAMAGGLPIGAVGIGGRVQNLTPGVHGSTFGGNPLACAAANAVLAVMEAEGLHGRAAERGAYFMEQLWAIPSPLIREVRGLGLLVGVELKIRAMEVVRGLMERGVLALTAGSTVLRLTPPLVITKEEIDQVVEAIAAVLVEM
ncbi:MAG: acetylornithine/succinylornithine family transaminase [Chloroflexi bacterium]|nr:acetylornithine/succinylornithine family transaminase [Ardenticatenaceae bacterium]MBL1128189.1 acetylornithine/succinylornithine family transaminase [Chloroflexota bacterium]NOG34262.1 acetylornithine/succinylornithine family transaminase [Chloroflexota bacterium]GIK56376.1 MAG: acetylornithine aminotransferase [Chloroflexota bacterium]